MTAMDIMWAIDYSKKSQKKFKESVRDTDLVGRLSGDEFIVVFDKCRGVTDIMVALNHLQNSFEKAIKIAR